MDLKILFIPEIAEFSTAIIQCHIILQKLNMLIWLSRNTSYYQ